MGKTKSSIRVEVTDTIEYIKIKLNPRNMERNVKISLKKAKEWYNSGNESLKEVALQAFKESELVENPWELIKTFEDACKVLKINPYSVNLIYDDHLQNIYKLQIVKKALNGADWEPKLNTGIIYCPWLKYHPKGNNYPSNWTPVADFKAKEDNKVYTLIGGNWGGYDGGLAFYENEYGDVITSRGLLGCKSKEIAKYFGITFGKLIFDATYGQYNNYTWV